MEAIAGVCLVAPKIYLNRTWAQLARYESIMVCQRKKWDLCTTEGAEKVFNNEGRIAWVRGSHQE